MDAELEHAYNTIMDAVCAEDVFGSLFVPETSFSSVQLLEEQYKKILAVVDPNLYNGVLDDRELASEAKVRLDQFLERARIKIADGLYGQQRLAAAHARKGRHVLSTEKRDYFIGEPFAEGTIATVHAGECVIGEEFAGKVAIKIVNDPADNELLLREKRMLDLMHASGGRQRRHITNVLDRFQTEDGRAGLIMRFLNDSFDLDALREHARYRNGVDQKHMVWMFNRILSAIGYAHSLGIVHGNLEPQHFLVYPPDHNVFIIDWCWSVYTPAQTGDQFKIATEPFSAPEVSKKGAVTPAADLYSIGKCMIYILGGDPLTDVLPDAVEEPLRRLLLYCVRESPRQRPQDAWQLWRILEKTVIDLWGPKKFVPFTV